MISRLNNHEIAILICSVCTVVSSLLTDYTSVFTMFFISLICQIYADKNNQENSPNSWSKLFEFIVIAVIHTCLFSVILSAFTLIKASL